MTPKPLVRPRIVRRLVEPPPSFKPDVEQERRVRNYLYGRRTQVELVQKEAR